ncbi:MAG TPA: SURF1 family protein [Gemmatimonadales bacterium]|nr:SURF1 family protein [Gemmatimonadales bacterium]
MPRSRLLLVSGLVFFAVVCLRLGFWQLDRLADRRSSNAAHLAKRSLPEVRLPEAVPAESLDGRPVQAIGRYDRRGEIVLRGQVLGGVPGIILVTPLKLEGSGDTVVLVERGFVPSPDALTIPPGNDFAEPGLQNVRGVAFAIDSGGNAEPLEMEGRWTFRRLELQTVRARLLEPVLNVVIRQTPDSALPSFPRRRPAPPLDEGPHRLYAIQWFAFATMAVVFAGIFLGRARAEGADGRPDRAPPMPRG